MYGLTRATLTLIGVALAGVLLWLATAILPSTVSDSSRGEYWAAFGLVALAGLAMALSQLLGGWTKWGWPRVSGNVFLLAFLPTLIAGGGSWRVTSPRVTGSDATSGAGRATSGSTASSTRWA